MKKLLKNTKGFIQIPILIAIIVGAVVIGGAGYVGVKQYWAQKTEKSNSENVAQNDQATSTDKLSEVERLRQEVEQLKSQQFSSQNQSSSPKQEAPAPAPVKRVALSNSDIIKKVKSATVYIETTDGAGSGMIIDANGYILTNAHVVWDVSTAKIKLSDGRSVSAEVIGRDEIVDLAILKIVGTNFTKVTFGDSDNVVQGDDVFTLGYPFGLEGDVSFKEGTISRRISDGDATYLETSAEIHPGNSGGPLVNKYGEVIGVNTASYGQTIKGVSTGETIKLAIPINVAKNLISELKNGRNIVIDHTQYEAPATDGGVDAATIFAIKAQCQILGQQKEQKENSENPFNGSALYGYSPVLNTCIYGRYHFFDLSSIGYILSYGRIYNLMTGGILYNTESIFIKNENISDDTIAKQERIKDDLWTKYNSLAE